MCLLPVTFRGLYNRCSAPSTVLFLIFYTSIDSTQFLFRHFLCPDKVTTGREIYEAIKRVDPLSPFTSTTTAYHLSCAQTASIDAMPRADRPFMDARMAKGASGIDSR